MLAVVIDEMGVADENVMGVLVGEIPTSEACCLCWSEVS